MSKMEISAIRDYRDHDRARAQTSAGRVASGAFKSRPCRPMAARHAVMSWIFAARRWAVLCPETLQHHSGGVIFGGPMSAYDEFDFLDRERALIEIALREKANLLGICLGRTASGAGAWYTGQAARPGPRGGWLLSDHSRRLLVRRCATGPKKMYQWHRDGFDLPHGADLLATSCGAFPTQAFVLWRQRCRDPVSSRNHHVDDLPLDDACCRTTGCARGPAARSTHKRSRLLSAAGSQLARCLSGQLDAR